MPLSAVESGDWLSLRFLERLRTRTTRGVGEEGRHGLTIGSAGAWPMTTGRVVADCPAGGPVLLAISVLLCGCGGAGDGALVATANRIEPATESHAIPIPALDLDALSVVRFRVRQPPVMLRNLFRFGADPSTDRDFATLPPAEASDPWWDEPLPWGASPWPAAVEPFDAEPGLVFLGVVEASASAGRVAVVKAGETVYHGRVGDVLAVDYRIVAIEIPRLDLEPLRGGSLLTLWMASGRP